MSSVYSLYDVILLSHIYVYILGCRHRYHNPTEMEYRLAEKIRHIRELGVPVETWMVEMEAKIILHELYPQCFPEPTCDEEATETFGFKCSRGWMDGFFKRFNFTCRAIGKKMNKKGVSDDLIDHVVKFHAEMRAL